MHTCRIIEWCRHCTAVKLLSNVYCLRQANYVPNIPHFKLLLWSDENTSSRKSLNVVSQEVPSTCPTNCAHIILVHSAASPMLHIISILLFHVQKLFNWFSKYVWNFVATIYVNSCFHSWNEKKIFRISGTADANNESSKNTNVKSEINKLSTNKRCHFLEIIAPIDETPEQKQDGYCNVDFVFMFGSNKCFLYLWHNGTLYNH